MIKFLTFYCLFGLLFASCDAKKALSDQNELTGRGLSRFETELPKEIFLLIGRGGCCNGHIITISKNGEIKYFVGSYSIPSDRSEMPEKYDSQLITQNPNYKPKYRKLSEEKINHLVQLVKEEQMLRFKDEVWVEDDFVYTFFLDKNKVASGFESRKTEFPKNLAKVLALILGEVELYNLPGMA
jgi:hypothetical protein